ncbi:hypothetical protein Glove_139g260 [Diversispora epigaea]|uniref:Ion transport domain-containing protein n=1 Tax=Diversispora epigaea TaxID=1348612 RepID=A0A397J4N3_9GLOM|nr:hypothetical protein Glove_139g260 [Diversispora epigaea]
MKKFPRKNQQLASQRKILKTHEFKLYDVDDLSSSKSISTFECGVNDKHLCWYIAISNCVDDDKNERFIALSCFDLREFHNDIMYGYDESDLESGDKYLFPQTWVISTTDKSEIYTSSIGGVIRFLDSDDSLLKNKTIIIIVNASGIYKETMNNIKRKQRFFSRSSKIEQFELLQQLSIHLSRDHWQNSLELLHTSIIKNHFMRCHESSVASSIILGSPIFAISQNEKILAFFRGTPSITLYFVENGLEITTKRLEGQKGIYEIVAINFIDEDSKLLIVLEEKEDRYHEVLKRQIFVVWDLFTTFENSIRQIDYSEPQKPLQMDVTRRLMNSYGKIFAVRDGGDIFSVLGHPDVALIRNPSAKEMTKIDITTNNTIQVWKYRSTIENRDKRDRELEYIWARKTAIDIQELKIGEREFVLKGPVPSTKCPIPKTMTIHWPKNVNVLKEACRALYILREKKYIVAGHENINKIKYLVECTQRLVRKYITKYGIFRLTSIRYPIMKYRIKSYQKSLIKHILNKKINKKNSNIYIPRLYEWEYEDNNRSTTEISKSDLHHAILCIQKRGDPTIILKYLIDYYTDNAKEYNNHGWMFTVSKAIPLLYDYHLREFVQYLFKKPCFGITEAYTPPLHINPYDQKKGNNAAVIHSLAVKPRLVSKFHNTLWFFLKNLFTRYKIYDRIETSHSERKVYIVPLPDFTVYPSNPKSDSRLFIFSRIFFLPFGKAITDTKKMSPFLRVIYEKGYEIYQTPAIMAVLGFKWSTDARRYYIQHTILYLFYAISYALTYELDNVSVFLPLVDIILGKIPLNDPVFTRVLAFTALVTWFEVLFSLRYFEVSGRFSYIIENILKTVWPFFAFMSIVVFAFGHAMFILLRKADNSSLQIPTYKINDTSNSDLYSNITIYQNVDKSSRLDNYYSHFYSSVEAVFFWTNGRWDQLDQWDNYAVNVISILGSIILVLIFQNMLIAFMNGAFDKANKESRIAAHKYRAEFIAKYEALDKPFYNKNNPRYIYYIPDPDMIDNWLKETKKDEEQKLRHMGVGENLAEFTDLTDFDYSDDDDKDYDIQDNSKKYRHIQKEGFSSTIDLDSIEPSTTKYNDIIDKISFIDEEIFLLKVTSKLKSKKLLKNVNHPGSTTTNVVDQLSIQERFNNLETRFDGLEQNLKSILKTLNNLNNPK